MLHEAILYTRKEEGKVSCCLCSHRCNIAPGKFGICNVRENVEGTLYTPSYGLLIARHIDPVEKKPLYHFQPGSLSYSIAAAGCNFQCVFCQNWHISQIVKDEGKIEGQALEPKKIVDFAIKSDCKSMAYTYTEPTIFMELAADCGRIAKQKGLANVFVSNGYMTKEAIDFASDWLDGINVDLKSFSEDYYKNLCKAKLKPVLETIDYIANHSKVWMEVTTLVVPGQNDSDEELKKIAEFLFKTCGADIPWHVSRFYPQYKFSDTPSTPGSTLQRAYDIAKAAGLHYVYIGNLRTIKGEDTYCPKCQQLLIGRDGFYVTENNVKNGRCGGCNEKIAGFELNS